MAAVDAIELDSIRDRLKAMTNGAAKAFLSVGDMVSAGQAMETAARPPAAFVAVASERAEANRTSGVHSQRVNATIAVLVVVTMQRADGQQEDVVDLLRRLTIGQLAGWKPTGARTALDYSGFEVLRMGEGLCWFQCSFTASWELRI